jgi:putative ABC transport system permease protein
MTLAIKTQIKPLAIAPSVRKVVRDTDPALAAPEIAPLSTRLNIETAGPRFNTQLLGAFAVIALILASMGIYGVIAYTVERRTTEIGVRLALGADRASVIGLVLRQGLRLVAAGLTVGLVVALAVSRFLESLLYETSPTNVMTYTAVALVLAAVGLLAGYVPALRAAKVDPVVALRCE